VILSIYNILTSIFTNLGKFIHGKETSFNYNRSN